MVKAKIIVFGEGESPKKTLQVLFNPSNYSISKTNKYSWKAIPGMNSSLGQYVNGDSRTLKMELFFDTYAMNETQLRKEISEKTGGPPVRSFVQDVRNFTDNITNLMEIQSDLHAPPMCKFAWGGLEFKGLVETVEQKFTMFLESGIPVRATLNVTMREYISVKEQQKKVSKQSADRTKERSLIDGEQLWTIAEREYGSSDYWREIAKANNILNPRELKDIRSLSVPSLEES